MPSSYAYHRAVENTYLVRDRDRQRRRDQLRVVLWVLPMAVAVLGYIWLQVRVLDTSYDIGRLEQELTDADRQRARLSLEVARRSSLPLVEDRARRELGMEAPKAATTLFWSEIAPGPAPLPVPLEAVPAEAVPSEAVPAEVMPAEAAPAEASP